MKPKISICGKKSAETEFMGYPMAFESAPEPTNIIWENR